MKLWFMEDNGFDQVLSSVEIENDEWSGADEQQSIIGEMEEPHRQCMEVDRMFHSAYHEWSFKDYSIEQQ